MFERFTDRARNTMAIANNQAHLFNHKYIGTEHILLGLLKEGGNIGIQALKNLNVDTDKMLQEIEKLVKSNKD